MIDNINFEDRVLCIYLQHPDIFKKARAFLRKEALKQVPLKYLYGKMLYFLEESKAKLPASPEVLKAAILKERPEDGKTYVDLLDRMLKEPLEVGDERFLEHYVSEIHGAAQVYNLKEMLLNMAGAIEKGDMTRAQKLLQQAAIQSTPESASMFEADFFEEAREQLAFSNLIKNDPDLYSPIPTGLEDIDDKVGGLFKTEFGLVQAAPGGGKSTCLQQFAEAGIMAGKKVVLVTLEMSKRQYWWRIASKLTGIPYKKFKFGELTEAETKMISDVLQALKNNGSKLHIVEFSRGATAPMIEAAILNLPYEVDLLVVDYLNLMSSTKQFSADNNWLSQGAVSLELKQMASSIYLGKGMGLWSAQQISGGKEDKKELTTSDAAFSKIPGHNAHAQLYIVKSKEGYFMGASKWRDGHVDRFQIYPDFSTFTINTPMQKIEEQKKPAPFKPTTAEERERREKAAAPPVKPIEVPKPGVQVRIPKKGEDDEF